ncbi:hypothetical protein ABZ297_08645 [Nonomuraea sp. NPDC005983]|uniref:HEAT repeat domain-containing protein n=1 Tax=Nonomuraea sp. NPDC005983 TaxID=3155595 RepID=UPI0033BAB79F
MTPEVQAWPTQIAFTARASEPGGEILCRNSRPETPKRGSCVRPVGHGRLRSWLLADIMPLQPLYLIRRMALANPDAIDWNALAAEHGDGEWSPVMRALCSEDSDEVAEAWETLWDSCCHQGTREGSDTSDIPYLVALAVSPDAAPEQRSRLLYLLTRIAIGNREDAPNGYPIAAFRAEAEAIITDERPPDPDSMWDADRQRLHQARFLWGLDAYDAVRDRLPDLIPLLSDHDDRVRCLTAFLFAWFPEEAHVLVPRLRGILGTEPDVAVRTTAAVAIAMLTDPGDSTPTIGDIGPVLTGWLDSGEPLERWAAAVTLARILGQAAPAPVLDVLLAWTARRETAEKAPSVPFRTGNPAAVAANTLPLCGPTAGRALDALIESLPKLDDEQALEVIGPLLELTFPDGPIDTDTPYDALSPTQRRVMRAIAAARNLWGTANFAMALEDYNLPASPVVEIGRPEPFQTWVGLGSVRIPIPEEGLPDGEIVLYGFREQEEQIKEGWRRTFARFDDAWGQVFDEQRFNRFLAELFDAAMEEYDEVFAGSLQVVERSSHVVKIDVTAAALVPAAPTD